MDGGMNISTADDLRVCGMQWILLEDVGVNGMQWMIGWYISTEREDVGVN